MDKEIKQEFENLGKEFENFARIVKEEFDNVHKEFDNVHKEISELRTEMNEQFHQLRLEIKDIWNKLGELEEKIDAAMKFSKEDIDAMAGDIFGIKKRVEFLENQLKGLQKI